MMLLNIFVFLYVMIDVTMNDRGLYSCNLHHLYCHLYETIRVQLNITKSRMYRTVPTVSFYHTQELWSSLSLTFCTLTIKVAKSSASGMDKRRSTWCFLGAPWCCRASTDETCGQTGATRRRTSRCVHYISLFPQTITLSLDLLLI